MCECECVWAGWEVFHARIIKYTEGTIIRDRERGGWMNADGLIVADRQMWRHREKESWTAARVYSPNI